MAGVTAPIPTSQSLLSRLLPPLCLTCGSLAGGSSTLICPGCTMALAALRPVCPPPPPGVSGAWSAAPHQGVARDLVTALKFRRLLPAAAAAVALIFERVPPDLLRERTIVPVPPAPLRLAWRGFDPAGELAAGLARRAGCPLDACLRRRGAAGQRGRGRVARLGNAPRIEAGRRVPERPLLLDDVMTTGATLGAAAAALRSAGAVDVKAVTFTHEL
jgi:predicted amidophosphoribosyltransferase